VPVEGSGIPGFDPLIPEQFDPFQVRRDLKYKDCTEWVKTNAPGDRNWETLDKWIDAHRMFESDAPAGALLDNPYDFFAIVNSPHHLIWDRSRAIVAQEEDGPAPRHLTFLGLEDGKTWWLFDSETSRVRPVYSCVAEECYQDAQLDLEDIEEKFTVPVFPGDVITIRTLSINTPHGLLFRLSTELDGIFADNDGKEADLHRFFEDIYAPFSKIARIEKMDPRFQPNEDWYYFGDSNAVAGVHTLFQGTVRDLALGTDEYAVPKLYNPLDGKDNRMELWFTDSVFGPAAMNVRLLASTNASTRSK